MSRLVLALAAALALAPAPLAQRATRRPPPPPAKPVQEAPEMICPNPLGVGVTTKESFCDVMTGRDPAGGILIKLPSHKGPVTLTFNLHNRHTYSEEQTRANRAFARYTASIGVLTMDNTLISRAAVQTEFRKATDLVDRVGGGAGPSGVKAVAPVGTEPITITIPEEENEVSILGEKVTVDRVDGSATYASPGRPIALISHVMIEYRPGPPPKPPRKTGRGRGA